MIKVNEEHNLSVSREIKKLQNSIRSFARISAISFESLQIVAKLKAIV